jgi:uncharacterized membrane protein
MDRGRVEAFSDGVLAVAITLLVLNLKIETGDPDGPSVASQLRHDWPSYAAYVVSFLVIGVIWVNHHALFANVERVDRVVLFLNLVLLMFVTTIPFTTSVLADTLRSGGSDARWGALLYGISMEGMSIGFSTMLARLLSHDLLVVRVPKPEQRRVLTRFGLGLVIYPLVVVVGLFSMQTMLLLYFLLTLYYMFEQTALLPAQVDADDEVT